jgi:lysophospholipase L1-like esterase
VVRATADKVGGARRELEERVRRRVRGRAARALRLERIAAITRRVAGEERAQRVDLRTAVIACLQNHNRRLELDGSLRFERDGLLIYDGIHPSELGNDLVAGMLADGSLRALPDR